MARVTIVPQSWQVRHIHIPFSIRLADVVHGFPADSGNEIAHATFLIHWQLEQFEKGFELPSTARAFGQWDYVDGSDAIQIPHYFIVAIFALLYGALKWVYRNREVPRD